MRAIDVYSGSDGELTRRYYAELQTRGRIGTIAMNLFRAQKCSERAKVYRGGLRGQGSFRNMAYERKGYSLQMLSMNLQELRGDDKIRIPFGWKRDLNVILGGDDSWVLYIDLPIGQVSFHSPIRYVGSDYDGDWDRQRASAERILAFCDAVMAGTPVPALMEMEVIQTEPVEPCSCAQQIYRNNLDGTRDFGMRGKPRCRKCRGSGLIRRCSDCEGAGIKDSRVCRKCGGSGSVPA
jgi:hypothetical protein